MTTPNDPTEPTPTWSAPSQAAPPPAPQPQPQPAAAGAPEPFPPTYQAPVSPVATVAPARTSSRKRGVVDVVLVVAAIFAVGGVGFALGRATAPPASVGLAGGGRFQGQVPNGGQFGNGGQVPNGGQGGTGGQGQGGPGGFFGAGGGITISGEVSAITADQLTLKLPSGQTIQIGLNGSTAYHSQAPATAADVTTGSTVQVQVARGGGQNGGGQGQAGNGQGGGFTLGAASNVTVVPK